MLVMGGSRQLKTNLNNLLSAKSADSLGSMCYFCSKIFAVAQRRNKTDKACKEEMDGKRHRGCGWRHTTQRGHFVPQEWSLRDCGPWVIHAGVQTPLRDGGYGQPSEGMNGPEDFHPWVVNARAGFLPENCSLQVTHARAETPLSVCSRA